MVVVGVLGDVGDRSSVGLCIGCVVFSNKNLDCCRKVTSRAMRCCQYMLPRYQRSTAPRHLLPEVNKSNLVISCKQCLMVWCLCNNITLSHLPRVLILLSINATDDPCPSLHLSTVTLRRPRTWWSCCSCYRGIVLSFFHLTDKIFIFSAVSISE